MNIIHTRIGDTEYRFSVSDETLNKVGPLDLAQAPIELVVPTPVLEGPLVGEEV